MFSDLLYKMNFFWGFYFWVAILWIALDSVIFTRTQIETAFAVRQSCAEKHVPIMSLFITATQSRHTWSSFSASLEEAQRLILSQITSILINFPWRSEPPGMLEQGAQHLWTLLHPLIRSWASTAVRSAERSCYQPQGCIHAILCFHNEATGSDLTGSSYFEVYARWNIIKPAVTRWLVHKWSAEPQVELCEPSSGLHMS